MDFLLEEFIQHSVAFQTLALTRVAQAKIKYMYIEDQTAAFIKNHADLTEYAKQILNANANFEAPIHKELAQCLKSRVHHQHPIDNENQIVTEMVRLGWGVHVLAFMDSFEWDLMQWERRMFYPPHLFEPMQPFRNVLINFLNSIKEVFWSLHSHLLDFSSFDVNKALPALPDGIDYIYDTNTL